MLAVTWMNLKNITLSEQSWTQKATLYDAIYRNVQKTQTYRKRK